MKAEKYNYSAISILAALFTMYILEAIDSLLTSTDHNTCDVHGLSLWN